jgi:hypothetical protein
LRYAKKNADEAGHTTTLMDPARQISFVTFLDTSRHLLLGYLFRREEFPCLETYWNCSSDGW